jgi:hypothetical protein
MTNEFNWGYTKNSINIFATNNNLSESALGSNPLPVLYPGAVQNNYLPNVSFSGSSIGSSPGFGSGDAPFINYNTTFDFTDNLTKVWGKHTIKAGYYMQRSRKNQTSFANFNGSYNFGDTGGLTGANPLDTGDSWANALLGVYNSFNQAQHHINGLYRYWNIEEFVQDTWKLTPRITFDYGLRGAWYQPQYDAGLQASTFVLADWDPKQAPRLYIPAINPANGQRQAYDSVANVYMPVNDIGLIIPGSGNVTNGICQAGGCVNKYLTKDRGEQWGPRFGVAWDVTGKQDVVIRTGAGIYYDRIQGNRTFDTVTNPPEAFSVTEQYGFAQQLSPANALLSPPSAVEVDPTGKIPTTYSYQFSVQTRLPWNMMLDTAYVGSQSRHQQDNRNLNWSAFGTTFSPQAVDPTVAGVSSTRPIGTNVLPQNFEARIYGYSNINLYESQATANYNALQVQLQRRASHGLFVGVSYTFSKAMATALSGGTNDNSFVRPDQYNRQANYAPASFDRKHVLAINYVYQAPRFKWGNWLTRLATDGWQLSGVTIAQTGMPITPGVSVQNSSNPIVTGSYTEGWRPVVVPGCNPYTHSGDWRTYLNPNCFLPAARQHRAGIGRQLSLRSGRSRIRHGASEGIRDPSRRPSAVPVPRRRFQRLQSHNLHRRQHRSRVHSLCRQQPGRDYGNRNVHLHRARDQHPANEPGDYVQRRQLLPDRRLRFAHSVRSWGVRLCTHSAVARSRHVLNSGRGALLFAALRYPERG